MDDQPVSGEQFSSPERDAHRLRGGILWAAALAILLLAIGLAVPDLRGVLKRVAKADPDWLIAAVLLEVASCLGYVATVRLVLSRGPKREVRWLAWAEMAFGAVVPVGGAGGLAVGAWAMRAWRIPWSLIANRSAVIFLLTSAVNASVLALSALAFTTGIGADSKGILYGLIPAAVAIAMITLFLVLPALAAKAKLSSRAGRTAFVLSRTADWVKDTEALILKPNWRLLGSLSYLLCDIAVLWACLRAVGTHPPVMAVIVGYQIGYLANLVPVPGGIGVLEGGLLGALLLYGLPAAPTAAAVVLYHAIALWIPVLGGTIGFARLRGALTRNAVAVRVPAAGDVPAAKASVPATTYPQPQQPKLNDIAA